ncbi:hypothetical protein BD324DRAFT_651659 [Kockovaella imperatae]|uniref:Uncharacterized protein n=1 Tax=Kockovaella imperatae TaxID=4999 RepID=A0A1Y1UED2_9TREE|nr:hypothetical protein BD324DRAFT_651659 [Kockovaella imperatae]ORX36420.1 hypothetical protein BD324DRAFT_651659 [Kockovaella imperatae]
MGSASSKAARRLPTTTPTAIRSVMPDLPSPAAEPLPSPSQPSETTARTRDDNVDMAGPSRLGPQVHSNEPFTGEKDDAIRRDALDPHFASNLSLLGPVYIKNSSEAVHSPALAQRTLAARRSQFHHLEGSPGPATLHASQLSDLLGALQAGHDKSDLCKHYGIDQAALDRLSRWTSVPLRVQSEYVQILRRS